MNSSLASRIRAANQTLLVEGDLDAVEEFFAADYVAHGTERDVLQGHDAIRGFLEKLRHAFPDLEAEVEILVEEGSRVAWQRTVRGTHENSFRGFPATGGRITWRDMITSRFDDGRIAEEWVISDLAERLLGARRR